MTILESSPQHAEILGWEVIGFPIKETRNRIWHLPLKADDYEQDRAKTVTYGKTINQKKIEKILIQ